MVTTRLTERGIWKKSPTASPKLVEPLVMYNVFHAVYFTYFFHG